MINKALFKIYKEALSLTFFDTKLHSYVIATTMINKVLFKYLTQT